MGWTQTFEHHCIYIYIINTGCICWIYYLHWMRKSLVVLMEFLPKFLRFLHRQAQFLSLGETIVLITLYGLLFQLLRRMIQQVKQTIDLLMYYPQSQRCLRKLCLTNCIQPFLLFSLIICQDSYEDTCSTALLKLTEDRRSALDDKKNVAVVAIDLSKAFDSLCHNLLLAKLKSYGVGNSAIDLIWSYLHGRKQRVKCNNAFSDWLPIQFGVPQGSLLGLLLFNIYMNDINSLVTRASLRLYADDTTTYD